MPPFCDGAHYKPELGKDEFLEKYGRDAHVKDGQVVPDIEDVVSQCCRNQPAAADASAGAGAGSDDDYE
jgi:hypothetical protein